MEDWQQRVIEEKAELDKKIKKLSTFLSSNEQVEKLNCFVHVAMADQLEAMIDYSNCLNVRILLFD